MTDEDKLVEFFRSKQGAFMGATGDYNGWTPAETAIHYLEIYSKHIRNKVATNRATEQAQKAIEALQAFLQP